MKHIYVEKFSALIDDVSQEIGLHFDPRIQSYVSVLLADHIVNTNFFNKPVGLRYMNLNTVHSAKELGDNCLVLVGIFPGYRGMNDRYYAEIGAGSYAVVAHATGNAIFNAMADQFDDLRELLNSIHPPRLW